MSGKKVWVAQSIEYVRQGNGRAVLTALPAAQPRPVWHQNYQQQNEARMQRLEREARLFALVHYCGNQPEALARYVEVVSAALRGQINVTNLIRYAPDELPDIVVDLFNVIRDARGHTHDKYKPTTVEPSTTFKDVLKVIEILGGIPANVVTIALSSGYFTLEKKSATEHLSTLKVTDFITSLERRPARDRAKDLPRLSDYPVVKDPGFLYYLLDCATGSSAQVRLAAQDLLKYQSDEDVVAKAIPMLDAKTVRIRTSAVQMLGRIGSDAALEAMRARAEVEKSQDVLGAIALFTERSSARESEVPEGCYLSAHGKTIEIPDYEPLDKTDTAPFDADDLAMLQAVDKKENERRMENHHKMMAAFKAGERWPREEPTMPKPINTADDLLTLLNKNVDVTAGKDEFDKQGLRRRHSQLVPYHQRSSVNTLAARLPDLRLVHLALAVTGSACSALYASSNSFTEQLSLRILDGAIDIRQVLLAAREAEYLAGHSHTDQCNYVADEAGYLSIILNDRDLANPPAILRQTWPVTAANLNMVLEALPPQTLDLKRNLNALRLLEQLPKLPMAAVDTILYTALDERRQVHELAQTLLVDVEGVDERIIATLTDKRQIVRSKAARLLADRGARDAVPAITKQLKTEKSESARAELIAALSRLGGDTSPYLGRAALVKEAHVLVKKLPNAKIDWLPLETAPVLRWADGKHVEPVVPDSWLRLALKLKSPAESSLFRLYYEQLDDQSVMEFGDWVLASWIAYDTFKLDASGLREQAQKQAGVYKTTRGGGWASMSIDQIAHHLMQTWTSSYPNSGNDAKGILALTHQATPTSATTSIAAYLKNHGKRVSQAKSLVEVLAAMATPEAMQVLVATATRFKQRTVRQLAETCVTKIADERNWTEDELADRSIPSGGIEADGVLILEVGEQAKPYTARLGSDLSVKLFNADGKQVKAIPAGNDDNSRDSRKLLTGAKKIIKTVVTQQSTRLYDAMVGARQWTLTDWEADIAGHPIMVRLIERVIWRALAEDGSVVAVFRPTPEGDRLTADGDDADLSAAATIDIAHTMTVNEDVRQAWLTHMKDFEI